MVKTLRRKLILIITVSVTAVFLLILSVINIINYQNVLRNANEKLDILVENGGTFPEQINDNPFAKPENNQDNVNPPAKPENNQDNVNPPAKPEGNQGNGDPASKIDNNTSASQANEDLASYKNKRKNDNTVTNDFMFNKSSVNAETPFETRYFTVTLSASGNFIESNVNNIAAIKEDGAKEIAEELFSNNKSSGKYEDYMYKRADSNGNYMYIFIDCKRDFSSFYDFLMSSIIVAVIGIALVLLVAFILSKIALKPVIDSIAKQKRFITDASHELKTPVAIINADIEIVEMENGESEWTKSITKQTNRLTNLTEQMVFLSRMDEGAGNSEFTDVNASELFREVSESFEPIAIKQNKTLNIYIDAGIHIKGDEKNLGQMLSLLMDNAFKYSNDEGNVDVTFHKNSGGKVLRVANSVEEIEPGNHDELFGRFYRRDKSRNSKTGGFGIGLSVVAAIADSHKAKISANSVDGKSIEFKVVF